MEVVGNLEAGEPGVEDGQQMERETPETKH